MQYARFSHIGEENEEGPSMHTGLFLYLKTVILNASVQFLVIGSNHL